MNISGIRPAIGFYDYNSIKINPELSSVLASEKAPVEEVDSSPAVSEEDIVSARQSQTFGSYDFASQYKPGTVYEMKGADSDIKSLDVAKAVNDMEKDSAIHRYQYFVQAKPEANAPKPEVRRTENFSL
jgi:hypothetical protein